MALDQIPHLPGAAPDSPDKVIPNSPAPGAVAKSPANGVKLSDLSYDDKGCLRGKSTASAFFMQPGYGFNF